MKKTMSVLIALLLMFTMAASAMAESGTNDNSGSITIDNAVVGQTYTIYQILELESYNTDANAYAYKATAAWSDFINSTDIKGTYVDVDAQGYVTWKEGASAADFATLAQAYAAANKLGNQGSATAVAKNEGDKTATVSFTGLNLGYYLVDSSLGTLCSLNTTNPNAKIEEKNAEPTNVKTVEEDSTGNYGSVNDADIGQTVNFKSTITAQPGAENYVFEDTMSSGLTYKNDAKVYTDEAMNTEMDAGNYTVNNNPGNGKTFTITFEQSYLNTITEETKLYVKYSATLNESAKVGLEGNPNKSVLKYGDSNNTKATPDSTTTTYTWDMDVLKYANGDKAKTLEGAQFVLLSKDTKKVATVANGKLTGWVDVPTAGEDGTITWPENTVLTTDEKGKIHIDGLDADTYYLREVKAPNGYNKLANDVKVEITAAKSENGETMTYTKPTAKVNNQSGTELPSTGGIGTTVFYVVGGALVLIAVVLLVTRKKMNATKD